MWYTYLLEHPSATAFTYLSLVICISLAKGSSAQTNTANVLPIDISAQTPGPNIRQDTLENPPLRLNPTLNIDPTVSNPPMERANTEATGVAGIPYTAERIREAEEFYNLTAGTIKACV